MTRNTVIRTLESVKMVFCKSFSQICSTTLFVVIYSAALSELLSARGLGHSHCITYLFFVMFSVRGLEHCGCQLPQALPHVACRCFLSVGIHICSPPHNSIRFRFQLVGGICFLVNDCI